MLQDPYLYNNSDVLKNLANIRDIDLLAEMEADYTSFRLSELAIEDSVSLFDFNELCRIHYHIFQDIYDWAGKLRKINIEKPEPALGGISIEYSDCINIESNLLNILHEMNSYQWKDKCINDIIVSFSEFTTRLWKVHPFREGNTRTIITFCNRFIESKGIYIDSELLKDNSAYVRTALVAASAIFSDDLGDRRKPEYIEKIIGEAIHNGLNMKEEICKQLDELGCKISDELIKKIVYYNRNENCVHSNKELKKFISVIYHK